MLTNRSRELTKVGLGRLGPEKGIDEFSDCDLWKRDMWADNYHGALDVVLYEPSEGDIGGALIRNKSNICLKFRSEPIDGWYCSIGIVLKS